jgi:hypothetical protein
LKREYFTLVVALVNDREMNTQMTHEELRLEETRQRRAHWQRWGPYLSERAWGTVREDYSPYGSAWEYLSHDHARSRAYRWNEDGIAGICDRHQYICFAVAFWNGRDPILKERLFGLTGNEGNHGEDVKECYFYFDSTPTHSYMKYLYKYPHAAFPYAQLVEENRRRDKHSPEFELMDTGVFSETAISTWLWSTQRARRKIFSCGSASQITVQSARTFIFYQQSGSGTPGPGDTILAQDLYCARKTGRLRWNTRIWDVGGCNAKAPPSFYSLKTKSIPSAFSVFRMPRPM